MDPVFSIDDSEDEACQYLKTVQSQRVRYASMKVSLGESEKCSEAFVPFSHVPEHYKLPLSQEKMGKILNKFASFRREVQKYVKGVEKKRAKSVIKETLFSSQPLFEVVKELDQLTIWKILKCIAEWIEEFERLEQWVYCMLVLLELPISLDLYSVLNKIMVKAIEFSPKPSALVIIAIISEYFGQKIQ